MNIKIFIIRFLSLGRPDFPPHANLFTVLQYSLHFVLFVILYGCSLVYKGVVQLRIIGYRKGLLTRYSLPCPIFSIGNITTGGTGKTPMVIQITQILRQHGKRVVILTRGYRRKGSTPSVILPGSAGVPPAGVRDVGDEPLLIARKFQRKHKPTFPEIVIIVGSQRHLSGKLAIEQFQPDVMLLDDGFQHLQLERTFDLVLIDATNPFGGNHLLPAGFLREPVKNLARAQAFVITRSDEIEDIAPICQRLKQINPEAPIFSGRYICDEIRRAGSEERIELDRVKQNRTLSVSGLANPGSFHRLLNQRGLSVVKHLDFPDHHWYTEKDARQIQQTIAAQHIDAIITTEKDEAKLLLHSALLKASIYVMTITLDIQPKEEFESVLLNVIDWS